MTQTVESNGGAARLRSERRDAAEAEPFTRLLPGDESALPPHVQAIFTKFQASYGFIPNWLRALSANPDSAYRLVTFYEHLFDPKRSQLTAPERELIAVVTSAANECSYCVFNHTKALGEALGDAVRARRIAQGFHHVKLSPREQLLAELSERLTRAPTSIGDDDLARLAEHGYGREAILEIFEISAFFSYANRLTIALNVVPDRQFFT